MLAPRMMINTASKLFAINPARVIIDGNTLIAGAIKIIFINDNTLSVCIDNVSINLTF